MARMGGEAGVVDAPHLRQSGEPLCQFQGRGRLGQHAQFERFHAPGAEIRLQRPHHGSGGILQPVEARAQLRIGHDERSTKEIAMAAEILCGGVHHDVGAMVQWPAVHRRGEGGIAGQQGSGRMGYCGAGGDVGDRQ